MRTIQVAGVYASVLALAALGTPAGAQARAGDQDRTPRYGYQARYETLTGTYELDRSRSDDPQRIVDDAMRQLPPGEQTAVTRRLMRRLNPPEELAIDQRGNQVSLASSRVPEMTFVADGGTQTETGPGGRQMATRAALYGDRLEVSATGTAGNDFSVSFAPLERGDGLRMTRRVFDAGLRAPIVMQSVYQRTSTMPDWDVYSEANLRRPGASPNRSPRYSGYNPSVVPEGTTLVARLDRPIHLSSARPDERVTLVVDSAPEAYLRGAVIEGYLLDTPTTSNGRTSVNLDFDTVRLQNGQSGRFDGIIEGIRGPNGEAIEYNGEPVQPNDQQQQAVQRGAVGAAVGALIGAIAGGGKGALIGAVLGGGGAAATVVLDPRNASTLPEGTAFTIRAQASQR